MSMNIWNAKTQQLEKVAGLSKVQIDDTTTSNVKTWSSEKINANLDEKGGRRKAITFPFIPTENGTLICTIIQGSANPITRGLSIKENGKIFYYINHYFGGSWSAFSTTIPLIKGQTYTVEDVEKVIMYEKTVFIY